MANETLGVLIMKTLFLDESGRTGTQKYNGKWNFDQQPYFILSGLIVPNDNVDVLNNYVKEMASEFKLQGQEVKFSNKGVKRQIEKIVERIIDIQSQLQCQLLLEVVNKKYCIAMVITEYCFVPYYDIPNDLSEGNISDIKQSVANYVYEFISNELLGEYVDFFDSENRDISNLITLCRKLQRELKSKQLAELVDQTIDTLENHEFYGLSDKNCLPLQDRYKGGTSSVAVCPHIDAFNNMIKRMGKGVTMSIHDHIGELEEALQYNLTDRLKVVSPDFLQFGNSRKYPAIQIADIWAGYIVGVIRKKLSDESIPPNAEKAIDMALNFVGSFNEQSKIFPHNAEILFKKIIYDEFKSM